MGKSKQYSKELEKTLRSKSGRTDLIRAVARANTEHSTTVAVPGSSKKLIVRRLRIA